MGRDSLVLLDWQQTGKPPLLGPQTSALPFNQSAVYFYLLFPFFSLTQGSPYSALYTLNLFYMVVFSLTFYMIFRSQQKRAMSVFLTSILLITLHPQFIIQNRFVWNPSFVGPLILAAFFLFYFLTQHFTLKKVFGLGLTLGLAVSLSYSVIPIVIGFGVVSCLYFKKKVIWIGGSLVTWLLLFNLPTVFFEVRHHFLLTQMMLQSTKVVQNNIDFSNKILSILNFIFTSPTLFWEKVLAIFFTISMVVGSYLTLQQKIFLREDQSSFKLFVSSTSILVVGILLTLLLPVPILAHYIFGLVVIGCVLLSSLPMQLRIFPLIFFVGIWTYSVFTGSTFKPAVRTISQMERCYNFFCKQEKAPIFVSLQSGLLPFHNGPEHRYLLKRAGCNIKNIETEVANASKMAIIVESSQFTFGQTNYSELAQFQPKKVDTVHSCEYNLQIITVSN